MSGAAWRRSGRSCRTPIPGGPGRTSSSPPTPATSGGGVAKWLGGGIAGLSYALTRAMREVLLGADPPVALTRRAEASLAEQRETDAPDTVHLDGTVITRVGNDVRWWTWAGYRANATLAATVPSVADPLQRPTDCWLRLRENLTSADWRTAREHVGENLVLPDVDPRAVRGLKFSATCRKVSPSPRWRPVWPTSRAPGLCWTRRCVSSTAPDRPARGITMAPRFETARFHSESGPASSPACATSCASRRG